MSSYDLFISYARRDNQSNAKGLRPVTDFVEHIKRDFAQVAGRELRPFFDLHEIHGMDDWRHRILQGLRESRLFLAFLSPGYLKSEYCAWEVNEYLKHEIREGLFSEGVAPVYFVEIPDWSDKTIEQRLGNWAAEVRRRNRFNLQPWYHDGEEALLTAGVAEQMSTLKSRIRERIRRGEIADQAKGNVDQYNLQFTGRSTEMRLLREAVGLKQVGVMTVLQGLGGIGKTALTCAYAHAFAAEYPGGRWQIRCEGRTDLRAAFVSLVGTRDFSFEFGEEEKRDLDLQFERVMRELRARAEASEPKRVLVILDNVDKLELLAPAQTRRLPRAEWLHLIATTRLGEAELGRGHDRTFVAINELPEQDAVDLIEKWQPEGVFKSEPDRAAALAIARLLGGFTLAVEAAAVFLGQNEGTVTLPGFQARLAREGLAGLELAASDPAVQLQHDEKRLSVTLQPALDGLRPDETLFLTYAALLPADFVVLPWLRTLMAAEYPELGQDAEPGYADPWITLVRRMLSLRLLQATGDIRIVRVHRLVQELVRQRAGEADCHEREQALLSEAEKRTWFLSEAWIYPETRWEVEPLLAYARHGMESERTAPSSAGWASGVGSILRELNRFTEAESLLRRALAILEKGSGSEHPQVAKALNNLAELLRATNRLAKAELLHRRALAILEKSLGPEHPQVATALNNLALLLRETNRLAEAEPLYRRAMAILEKSLGFEHPQVAKALNNLAVLLSATNRLAEAEPLYRRALAIHEKSYSPHHPTVAIDLNNLASLLYETNRLAEAEPLLRRALAIWEKSLGSEHPQVAAALNNLAELLRATNQPAEADLLLCRALVILEKGLGSEHPQVAKALNNLGLLLSATNRLAEAEPLLRRALAIDEKSYGPDHPTVAIDLNNLALLLRATNRLDETEPLLRRALAISEKSLGSEHPHAAAALNSLALTLSASNRLAEAKPLYRRSLEILLKFTRTTGHTHPHLIVVIQNYASLLQNLGESPKQIESRIEELAAKYGVRFGPTDEVA